MKPFGMVLLFVSLSGLAIAGTPAVPEISPVSGVAAILLLSGALLVIIGRRGNKMAQTPDADIVIFEKHTRAPGTLGQHEILVRVVDARECAGSPQLQAEHMLKLKSKEVSL